METTTPVVFFAYNRAGLTRRVLEAMAAQTVRPSRVLVYADAPARPEDAASVADVRALLRQFKDLPLEVTERTQNLGSAGNIVEGLTEVLARYPRAIIVEDDVLPSRVFSEAMLRLLDHYADQPRVYSVGGYPILHPGQPRNYVYDVIMNPRFSCWGWAVWADRWARFGRQILTYTSPYQSAPDVPRQAGDDLVQADRCVRKFPGRYWDYPILLESVKQGWLHAHTRDYLVHNIGAEGGVNYRPNPRLQRFMARTNPMSKRLPEQFPPVIEQPEVARAVCRYVAARDRAAQPTWVDRGYAHLQNWLRPTGRGAA